VRLCRRDFYDVWKYRTAHLHQVFFLNGKTATETYQLLQQAYSEDALGHTQVFDWLRRFKEGRTSVESDPPLGTTVNIEKQGHDC